MILIMFLVFSCPWQPPFQSISSEVWQRSAGTYLYVRREQITSYIILENSIIFWARPAPVIGVLDPSLNSEIIEY